MSSDRDPLARAALTHHQIAERLRVFSVAMAPFDKAIADIFACLPSAHLMGVDGTLKLMSPPPIVEELLAKREEIAAGVLASLGLTTEPQSPHPAPGNTAR